MRPEIPGAAWGRNTCGDAVEVASSGMDSTTTLLRGDERVVTGLFETTILLNKDKGPNVLFSSLFYVNVVI